MTSGITDWIVGIPLIISALMLFFVLETYGHYKILTQKRAEMLLYIAIGMESFSVISAGVFGYPTRDIKGLIGFISLVLLLSLEAGILYWVKNTPQEEAFKQKKEDEKNTRNSRKTPPPAVPQTIGTSPPTPLPNSAPPVCPYCGGPLEYVMEYNRWYCRRCSRYV